jgi:hypothetical protein
LWESIATTVDFEKDADGAVQPVFMSPGKMDFIGGPPGQGSRVTGKDFRVAEGSVLVPLFSVRGVPPERFLEDLTEFCERHAAPFVVVTGWPLVDWVPELAGCLITFGASAQVGAAAAAVLAGEVEARGSFADVL